MKKGIAVVLGSLLLSSVAFAHGCCNCCCKCNMGDNQMMMKKHKKMMKKKMMQNKQEGTMQKEMMNAKVKPKNIDKNNVGVTAGEAPDQTDPSLIEGNLENNDFKN